MHLSGNQISLFAVCITVCAKEVSYCDFEALCPKQCLPFPYTIQL